MDNMVLCSECRGRVTSYRLIIKFNKEREWSIPLCKSCWDHGEVNWAVNVYHKEDTDE